jgi:arginyl-tRNA synthetase
VWYYESDLYTLGKDLVQQGLEQGVFYQKDDGSVWIDLEAEKLGQKLLLRSNGTAVYITQDLGTAKRKFDDYKLAQSVYVVAHEQEYHFKVLFSILKKLGFAWADGCHHLSYGMVFLPEGKMKSREGKVVDADDLMENMVSLARETMCNNALEGVTPDMIESMSEIIGLGAIKYYILDFHPTKSINFDPQKSIAFQGNTGPYLQYAYVRILSIFRKSGDYDFESLTPDVDFSVLTHPKEVELAHQLFRFPEEVRMSGESLNPSGVSSYLFSLAKLYSQFYHACPILTAGTPELVKARLVLCKATAIVLKRGLALLDIAVPERM